MPYNQCQIIIDAGNATIPFTFPAGTTSALVRIVSRGAPGSGQNGGGGGGYADAVINSPLLDQDAYEIEIGSETVLFRVYESDTLVSAFNAVERSAGVGAAGNTTTSGGNGGEWIGGGGGCGGGGAGGPDTRGVQGEQNDDNTGGSGGGANGGADSVDLTDGIGPTRVYLVTNDGGRGGNGGNVGQDGQDGAFPGGGGGGHGDSPPLGPGAGGAAVVVILMEVGETTTAPTVTTGAVNIVTPSALIAQGSATGTGITRRGFAWSHSSAEPTIDDDTIECGDGEGDFVGEIVIRRGERALVRAFAVSGEDTVYGDAITITPRSGFGLLEFEKFFQRRRRVFMRRIRRDAAMDGEPE